MISHECKFTTLDGFTLTATHTVGKGRAVVLWLHGITANRDEYLAFFREGACHMASEGIDSLRFDFRGHGQSSGSSLDFTIVGQMLDVEAALEFLNRTYANLPPIYLVGCSFGAPPAIFAAIRHPTLVRGLSLVSPVLSYTRTFFEPETGWARDLFTPAALAAISQTKKIFLNESFAIGLHLIEEMRIVRPDLALCEAPQPVLLIHGDADSMVPYAVSREISERAANTTFVGMPSMDHGFTHLNDDEGKTIESMRNRARIFDLIERHCQ